jgi:hypothetical protein
VKFILSRFDTGFFSENRREKNEKMSILDNFLLFKHLCNLSKGGSLLNEDNLGGSCSGQGDEKEP